MSSSLLEVLDLITEAIYGAAEIASSNYKNGILAFRIIGYCLIIALNIRIMLIFYNSVVIDLKTAK